MSHSQIKSAFLFIAIGLVIYVGLFGAAEWLVYKTGKSNPFFKIATADQPGYDWVILGASHAMPLSFSDVNSFMERETKTRIIDLASPGTGPLYNRFVFEQFLQRHNTKNLLYVVDSFAFYYPEWNEDRFSDANLLRRTPFDLGLARRFLTYCRKEQVDPRALLDYISGFSKINNRERFEVDVWEGEKQFEHTYRPSASATRNRIAYLYPRPTSDLALSRYLSIFSSVIGMAQERNAGVLVIKLPVPSQFLSQLPAEPAFDSAIRRLLNDKHVELRDFSRAMDDPRFYFDTDHLNRVGTTEFFERFLKAMFIGRSETSSGGEPQAKLP
ncbi:MAG: hypothetical protein WBX25_29290 [Rhodomicrobium sp.]